MEICPFVIVSITDHRGKNSMSSSTNDSWFCSKEFAMFEVNIFIFLWKRPMIAIGDTICILTCTHDEYM